MFRADQPINTHKQDLLSRHSFAKALAKAILSYELDDSISVGLFGEWGSGKTSLINMTLEEIKSLSSQREPFAHSGEVGHLFRSIPAICSSGFRPLVPVESGHRFRGIPATP